MYIYIHTHTEHTQTHGTRCRSIVEGERECRMLRVQRTKLERLAAALKSERLAEELTGEARERSISADMYKLLQLTSKLKAQVDVHLFVGAILFVLLASFLCCSNSLQLPVLQLAGARCCKLLKAVAAFDQLAEMQVHVHTYILTCTYTSSIYHTHHTHTQTRTYTIHTCTYTNTFTRLRAGFLSFPHSTGGTLQQTLKTETLFNDPVTDGHKPNK